MVDGKSAKAPKNKNSKLKLANSLASDDLIVLAKTDFYVFMELMFQVLHPGVKLVHAPYIELIVECLMVLPDLEKPRMIFNLPPGYMKSTIISILYTAWKLGVDPTRRFICISYGDDLAHELSERTRKIMMSELYQMIFPGTILEKKAQDHLKTTKGGARYATAVGSDITGFRANEIIIDDPIQPKDSDSERVKVALQNWFYSSVLTRLVDQRCDSVVLVMHRLSPNDLSGVLEQLGWLTIKLPLVAESDQEFEIGSRFEWTYRNGETLNQDRFGALDVKKLRDEIPSHVFQAQYQQRPTNSGSGLFSLERVARYDELPKFEFTIHSWDVGATMNGNYSVCTKLGVCKNRSGRDVMYVLEVVRVRGILPDVQDTIEMLMKQDKPTIAVIDANGVGMGVFQFLEKKYGFSRVKCCQIASSSKIERFGVAMQYLYDSRVLIPLHASWLELWLYEMVGFPNGENDDQVDSLTQVVSYFENVVMAARQALARM